MSAVRKTDLFSEGTTVRILTFDVRLNNGEIFTMAMNIQKIKEILDTADVNVQPLTPNYLPLVGLLNLRHVSIPILDIAHFLGNEAKEEGVTMKGKRIIVCEFQRLNLGIVVENIHKIRQFSNASISAVPEVLSTFPGNVFNGVLEDDGKFIKLLDIEFILTQLNVDIAPETATKTMTGPSLTGKRILVVEDSRLFQKKLLHYFEERGATVFLAENGEEGLSRLKETEGKVDLIFTDIEMPVLNGIGMVRKIKENENWQHLPVIFNTSISNPGLVEDIEREGLGFYIVKFDEKHIGQVLEKVF